jgi:hypothetical protein
MPPHRITGSFAAIPEQHAPRIPASRGAEPDSQQSRACDGPRVAKDRPRQVVPAMFNSQIRGWINYYGDTTSPLSTPPCGTSTSFWLDGPPLHRKTGAVAASNDPSRRTDGLPRCSRLLALDERGVTFRYKD